MSLLFRSNECSLVDHWSYILDLYKNIVLTEQETLSFAILSNLFSITNCKKQATRKRHHNSDDTILEETLLVKHLYESFIQEIPTELRHKVSGKCNSLESAAVRDLSRQLLETTVFDFDGINGGNNSGSPLRCKVKDELFLMPQKCRFYCGCVKEQCVKLDGSKFDIVIADPPWWNKFIRRLKTANDKLSYNMMYNEDIASIPVKNLFSANCLIAVWCTNSPSNITAVKDLIFPNWGVQYLTTWYWLKVTTDLEPLCAFGAGCKKQPYERLILGKVGDLNCVPESQLFVSVPSALHSHKPPLLDLLKPYVKMEDPQILELFARYLLPNTTSVGYEPLKWQHMSCYETVS